MKRSFRLFVTFITFLLLAVSCYYDNEESLYPSINSSCDTVNVTFTTKISTLLANNCFSCHSNATASSAGNNIRLENYIDVVARATAIKGSINHTGIYSPMPKNGGKLSACLLTQFDIWVRTGMPEN
jgi:hypothetical protein